MFYQKITDIFAECSIDYDKNSDTATAFYKTIQNKFHFAITGKTAAEIIYDRVSASKDNMGLTTWENSPDGKILKSDVIIAKNYLGEKEIKNLNNLVNLFLDIAENNAERNIAMHMEDWKNEVENALKVFHYDVLDGKGKISHEMAKERAFQEYEKYKRKPSGTTKKTENLSPCRQGGNNHEHTISLRLCRKFITPTEIKRRKKEFRRRDILTGKTDRRRR